MADLSDAPCIVWFRDDLRLSDYPALHAAVSAGRPVIQLPKKLIQPWEAAPLELASAGVTLGKTYPQPIVDHRKGRERALKAYEKVRTR